MSNENQTEATENTRNEAVSDEAIITAYLEAAANTNDEGEIVGHLGDVAEATGMNMGSLSGRLTSLRAMGCEFPKLARRPSTGKTRKKSKADVLALFNKINSDLGKPAKVDGDDSQG